MSIPTTNDRIARGGTDERTAAAITLRGASLMPLSIPRVGALSWPLVSVLALLPACDKSAPSGGASAPASAAVGTAGAVASAAGAAGVGAAAAPSEAPRAAAASGAKGIQVAIKDLQIFHPYSAKRTLQPVRDDGTLSTRDARSRYGVGIVLEATNETGEILRDATFEGSLRFMSGDAESICELFADSLSDLTGSRFLSYSPKPPRKIDAIADLALGPQTSWRDEGESTVESPWRLSERIRMTGRKNECETSVLGDLGVSEIRGRIVVKAGAASSSRT